MSKLGKSRIAAIAKISALALCFALVFAMTMALTVGNLSTLSPGVASAAEAGDEKSPSNLEKGDNPYWNAQPQQGDHGDNIFTDIFPNKPTEGSGSTVKWVFDETFENIVPSETNQAIAKGNNNADTNLFGASGGNNYWYLGYQNSSAAATIGWGFTYKLPTFVVQLLNTGRYKIDATASFDGMKVFPNEYEYNENWWQIVGGDHNVHYYCRSNAFEYIKIGFKTSNENTDVGKVRDTNGEWGQFKEVKTFASGFDYNASKNYTSQFNETTLSNIKSEAVTLTKGNAYLNLGIAGKVYNNGQPDRAYWASKIDVTSSKKKMEFWGLHIVFTITLNTSVTKFDDGSAPAWTDKYNILDAPSFEMNPRRTSDVNHTESDNWPVFHPDLASTLNRYNDTIDRTSSTLTLQSFTDSAKTVTLTFCDTYDYGNIGGSENPFLELDGDNEAKKVTAGASNGFFNGFERNYNWQLNDNCKYYASGIYSVAIKYKGGSPAQTSDVKSEQSDDGVFRTSIFTFYKNGDYEVEATDYGGRTSIVTIYVQGIDQYNAKLTLSEKDDQVATSLETTNWKWYNDTTGKHEIDLTVETDETDKLAFTPYVFFPVWDYENDKNKFVDPNTKKKSDVLENGTLIAEAFISGDYITATSGGKLTVSYDGLKETGYYRLTLYAIDLAGNVCRPASSSSTDKETLEAVGTFYMRVDKETPEFELEILSGSNVIDSSDDPHVDGVWANDVTSIKITLTKKNISGNTIVFTDISGTQMFAINENGEADKTTLSVQSQADSANFTITISNESDGCVITLKMDETQTGGKYIDFVLSTKFTVYAGYWSSEPANGTALNDTSDPSKWGGEGLVKILSDRNAPTGTPELASEGVKFKESYQQAVRDREWFNLPDISNLEVTSLDDLVRKLYDKGYNDQRVSNYFNDITIYYAWANVVNRAGYDQLNTTLESLALDGITNEDKGPFDFVTSWTYREYAQTENVQTITKVTNGDPVGVRVICVWMVDQAGNVAKVQKTYFLPVDSTIYDFGSGKNLNVDDISSDKIDNAAKNQTRFGARNGNNEYGMRGQVVELRITLPELLVPFKLAIIVDGKSVPLLENYTADLQWIKASVDADNQRYLDRLIAYDNGSIYEESAVDGDPPKKILSIKYKLDNGSDEDDMGALSLSFEYKSRQKVTPLEKNNENVVTQFTYTAQEVKFKEAYNINISAAAKEALRFAYMQDGQFLLADGSTTDSITDDSELMIPINVGTYDVYVFIPINDDSFVLSTIAFVTDGDYTKQVYVQDDYGHYLSILQKDLNVVALTGSSVYGEYITLKYESDDLCEEDIGKVELPLKLKVANWDAAKEGTDFVDVGTYDIIYDGELQNYNLVDFTGATYTVTKREITIHAISATKQYGDNDPDFQFNISQTDQEGLGWLKNSDKIKIDFESILSRMFENYEFESDGTNYIATPGAAANKKIQREAGDAVGSYNFLTDVSVFDSTNYTLKLETDGAQFTIEKRTVILDMSGNGMSITEEQANDLSVFKSAAQDGITPGLPAGLSSAIESEILRALEEMFFLINFGDTPEEIVETGKFKRIYRYTIYLGSHESDFAERQETDCFIFTLENAKYEFRVLGDMAIIISLKEGKSLSYPYGWIWNPAEFKFDSELFDVKFKEEYPLDEDDPSAVVSTVNWTASIDGYDGNNYLNSGTYFVNITNAKIILSNGKTTKADRDIVVDSVRLTITSVQIEIAPVLTGSTDDDGRYIKVYGQRDDVYGIGFKITKINGTDIAEGGTYGEYTYAQLYEAITNPFFRGVYSTTGTFNRAGETNDTVSDATGALINSEGFFYGLACNAIVVLTGDFKNNFETNISVPANSELQNTRFVIQKKEIQLNVKDFVGISRPYDQDLGTTVVWGNTLAYDLLAKGKLVLSDTNNNVRLAFSSEYTEEGYPGTPTHVGIKFWDIALEGDRAFNYVLKSIKLDDLESADTHAILYYGEDSSLEANYGAEIEFEGNKIIVTIFYILNGEVSQQITIQPGSIGLRQTDVTIKKTYDNTNSLEPGHVSISSNTANKLLAAATLRIQSYDQRIFGVNAGTYSITITLYFEVEGAIDYQIRNNILDNSDPNKIIDRNITIEADEHGFIVTIRNMQVTVERLTLTGEDFEAVDAVDRDYNGSNIVDITYTYAPDALPAGDTTRSVGLTIYGTAASKDACEPEQKHKVNFEDLSDGAMFYSFVDSRNYALNVDSFKEKFNDVDVIIAKAKLVPNGTFADKVYDGTSNVVYEQSEGSDLTTLNFADMLADELRGLKIKAVTYMLSINGEGNPDVALDEDGNVVAHNVMVRGLVITGDNDLLKNYVIYGSRFSGREYIEATYDIKSDVPIGDYEILSAMTVTKKQISIMQDNVKISDKVYDGTDIVPATIVLSEGDIPEADKDFNLHISVEARFIRRNVGTNIAITLSNIMLQCDETYVGKLKNYDLQPYTVRHYGNILARPVAMSADLGTKTYDGSDVATSYKIILDEADFIGGEYDAYSVQLRGGAHFVDKNVVLARDEDGNAQAAEKAGFIYDPTLRNTSSGIVNYILTYALEPTVLDTVDGKVLYAYAVDTIGGKLYAYLLNDGTLVVSSELPSDVSNIIKYYYELPVGERGAYFPAKGKIEQKQVYILSSAVYKLNDSAAFNKVYDGTNKFFGESGVDFDFRKNGISGVVTGDEVKIKNVSAVYGGADTSTSYVQFNLSEIEGRDADNYFWTEELVTATLSARIRKRPIYAALNDREIVYGTVLNSLVTEIGKDIQFFLDGSFTYDSESKAFTGDSMLTYDNGSFYIGFDKYVELMGLTGVEEKYIEQLWAMSFNYEDGQFVAAAEGTKGSYIRLGGSFDTLPSASLKFGTTRPNAGETSSEYTLSGGYATNFDFDKNFRYTDVAGNKTSKVTVTRMDLYVASSATTHSVIYGGEYPVNDIVTFFDANGNISTFAPWDSYTALFVKGGVDIGPIIKWVDSEGHEMVKYPDITKTYYAVIEGQKGYNYKDELPNYNLYFGSFKYDEGSASITFKESDLTLTTATLNISLPSADMFNISVVASNASFVFNGTDQTRNVLGGLNDSDMVYFEGDEAHVAKEYVYGGHVGRLVVRRFIKIDKKDERGYYVEWTSSDVITINITKASPQLTARNASVSYNGRERTYPLTGGSDVQLLNVIEGYGIELTSAMIESTITKLMPDGSYEPATLRDAGTYLISISLTPAFEESYPNFAAESVTANITITKASVEITIQEGEYEMSVISGGTSGIVKLASVYRADKQYTVDYTIRMVDTALAAGPYAITSDMLEINFFRENVATETDITGAGKYSFRIVPKDESINNNYEFIRADGILELTATTLVDVDDEGTVKNSLVFEEGSTVIANELIVHRVEKVSGSGEDLALYHSIEQYMPHIDSQASIAAVLKVSLKYDNVIVTDTNGASMTLSIKLPDNVKTDMSNTAVYVSTPEGGLKKLMPAGSTEAAEAGAAAEYGTYEFKDGVLTFTTDFLGAIVFVDVAPAPFPQWLLWTLVALGALVVVFLVWLIVTLTVRKIKLYHIDRIF